MGRIWLRWASLPLLLWGAGFLGLGAADARDIEVVDEIRVAEQDDRPTDARARAFSHALRQGVARAWARRHPDRPFPSLSPEAIESAVAFVDVHDETISPTRYSALYSIGVDLDALSHWAGSSSVGAAPSGGVDISPAVRIAEMPIRLGEPGAMENYRRTLAARGAHWLTIRQGEDGSLDISFRNSEPRGIRSSTHFE